MSDEERRRWIDEAAAVLAALKEAAELTGTIPGGVIDDLVARAEPLR